MASLRHVSVIAVLLFVGVATAAADEYEAVCKEPKSPLMRGAPEVNSESVSFTNDGESYQLEVYSGFAPFRQANGDTYCVRNELLNLSRSPITNLYWSEGPFTISVLKPNERESFIRTVGPLQPTVENVTIGAFKSVQVPTRAYKKKLTVSREVSSLLHLVADNTEIPTIQSSPAEPVKLPQGETADSVGAEFTSGDSQIGASATSWSDSETLNFKLVVASSSSVPDFKVSAPFMLAIEKASQPSDIAPLLKEYGGFAPLPDGGKPYVVQRAFPLSSAGTLFLIEQPITFYTDDKKICFLAPTYSPSDVPAELLACP